MDLSGIIFVVLALAWAVYLIPKALKHHDEVARTRSIDRFSTAMRVLARREPVSRRDARLVVAPGRATDNPRVVLPSRRPDRAGDAPARAAVSPVARPAERVAARAAARRRRRILSVLLAATLGVAVLAVFAVVSWWSVAIPATLTLLYLFLCRTQVRRSRRLAWEADLEAAAEEEGPVAPARRVAARLATNEASAAVAVRNAQGFEEIDPNEDTVAIPVPVLDAVAVPTEDGGSLWDPLPVTLPTYVTKPKAPRTVRTIDLGEPGTWTSGRSAEDTALVAEAAEAAESAEDGTAETDYEVEPPRAVGS